MFSNISIQPAGTLGPEEYSHRREQILDRIAKMHHMKKTAKTPHAKEAYQKEIAHEIVLLKRLNEQQQAETHDLELEEWIEPGFELVDMNA